jgi:hypothetical protein
MSLYLRVSSNIKSMLYTQDFIYEILCVFLWGLYSNTNLQGTKSF